MGRSIEDIWRAFHERLRRFVESRVRNRADAEDVVQDIFVRVHQGVGRLRDGERLLPWLFQVSRSAIADHYRKAARRKEVPADEEMEPVAPTEGDPAGAQRELARCVRPMLERVPSAYREAVSLVELEGMKTDFVEGADRATVSAKARYGCDPKRGGRIDYSPAETEFFILQKENGRWIISEMPGR